MDAIASAGLAAAGRRQRRGRSLAATFELRAPERYEPPPRYADGGAEAPAERGPGEGLVRDVQ